MGPANWPAKLGHIAFADHPEIESGQTGQSLNSHAVLEGNAVVIKGAARATDSVGMTFKMLDRLGSIIGAFQLHLWTTKFSR